MRKRWITVCLAIALALTFSTACQTTETSRESPKKGDTPPLQAPATGGRLLRKTGGGAKPADGGRHRGGMGVASVIARPDPASLCFIVVALPRRSRSGTAARRAIGAECARFPSGAVHGAQILTPDR